MLLLVVQPTEPNLRNVLEELKTSLVPAKVAKLVQLPKEGKYSSSCGPVYNRFSFCLKICLYHKQ